jgi:hypothetical protein
MSSLFRRDIRSWEDLKKSDEKLTGTIHIADERLQADVVASKSPVPKAQESLIQAEAAVERVSDTLDSDPVAGPQAVIEVPPSNQPTTKLVRKKLTCPEQLEEVCLQEGDQVQILANTSLLSEVYVIRAQVQIFRYR